MSYDIGAKIGIEGEAEFKKAIKEIDTNLKTLGTEMKAVTSAYEKNDRSVESLTAQNKVLNKQIDEQKNKLGALKTKLAESSKEYGENDARTQKWQQAVNLATADLSKMERQLKDNKLAIDNYSKAQIQAALDSDEFSKAQSKLMGAVKAIGVAVAAAGAAIVGFTKSALENADELQRLSDVTGFTAEKLQEFQYIGNNLGIELDTITGAQTKLIKAMYGAQNGSKSQTEAFEALGISVLDSTGQLRDSQEVMGEAIDALGRMENETQRDAYAMQLFGKSARDLNPLIAAGSDEINRLVGEARESGAVMSNEAVAGLDAFGDSLDNIKTALTGKFGQAFSELTPTLTDLADKLKNIDITPLVDGLKWVVKNADTIAAGAVAIGVGMAAWNVVTTVQALVAAMQTWKAATEGMTIAQQLMNLVMAANPIGIIITAVAALVAGIIILWNTNEDFRNAVKAIWASITGFFKTAWETIVNLWNGAGEFFGQTWEAIKGVFSDALQWGEDVINAVWDGIKAAWENVVSWFEGVWGKLFGNRTANVTVNKSANDVDGSYASGLNYVPFDGFVAELHKGEMVVPASMAEELRSQMKSASKQMGSTSVSPSFAGRSGRESLVRHYGVVRVEGVNSYGELVGVQDLIIDNLVQEARVFG